MRFGMAITTRKKRKNQYGRLQSYTRHHYFSNNYILRNKMKRCLLCNKEIEKYKYCKECREGRTEEYKYHTSRRSYEKMSDKYPSFRRLPASVQLEMLMKITKQEMRKK